MFDVDFLLADIAEMVQVADLYMMKQETEIMKTKKSRRIRQIHQSQGEQNCHLFCSYTSF